ncbi:hypothetical protein E8D34_09905 [Nocardioides sp. GY 10113]|uniref:hypothetical protein n=1 Tax=Nocardioides sp. GY 10113 TaxID=2569761 RepID=UPI0010A86BC5|nr:hypothetical protein [Nocardioides sp. GY 10113]TIC87435.1 hypothetical protein E8D34_09905 [Nocardioides sp. GY 10113]
MISSAVRRSAAALSLLTLVGVGFVLAAGPASADTPLPSDGGWEPKPDIDHLEVWLLFVGVPLLAFVLISAVFIAPALARGETINPAKRAPEEQWLGGPSKEAGELAAPDGEGSAAGGAGGSW